MTATEKARLHATIEGRVQGVGFRHFVQTTANELKLSGWVRNRWEGTVEVVAEGERPQVEKLLAALRRGPRSAHVSNVDANWSAGADEFSDFRVRATG
ncbi:MAG TPA: acylphosphatase [Anaerolineales bacterium]|nr:acylphosphatase [Anaerolineales bacterium]